MELSVPLKPVQELLNTVRALPVNLDTHTLKQRKFDTPEDKVCAAHFCQCSIQHGWWVPITTAILEAAYDFGPNPSWSSEQNPVPLCLERQGSKEKQSLSCQLLQPQDGIMGFGSWAVLKAQMHTAKGLSCFSATLTSLSGGINPPYKTYLVSILRLTAATPVIHGQQSSNC